ncbi:DUF2809 domain-containing protein [Flavihumibacter petaseus]|uniref:ribosomal maturation YjgA family protein n=1 Tax=Flavihumibacter petaseus TaxID=549295 RepID=UPI001FDF0067|nr:DUF2809 domain-containing protein [Flavihumibacter petaseus]
MFKFNRSYFLLATILFSIEVLIAVYVHDKFIRPYLGDFLVVPLMYCFTKSFLNYPPAKTAVAVLAFAFLIECLQYFNWADKLGLGQSVVARTILGSSFEWLDLLAYTSGFIGILLAERFTQAKLFV